MTVKLTVKIKVLCKVNHNQNHYPTPFKSHSKPYFLNIIVPSLSTPKLQQKSLSTEHYCQYQYQNNLQDMIARWKSQ